MIDMINILVVDDSIENNSEKGMWGESSERAPKNEMVVAHVQSTDVDTWGEVILDFGNGTCTRFQRWFQPGNGILDIKLDFELYLLENFVQ
jgi:hypothetical protein